MIKTSEFRSLLKELTGEIRREAPYSSALAMDKKSLTIRVDSKSQSLEEKTHSHGVVFRAFDGTLKEELSLNDLSEESLKKEIRAFVRRLGNMKGNIAIPSTKLGRVDFRTPVMIDPETIPIEEKLGTCVLLKDILLSLDENIREVQVVYMESRENSAFLDEHNDFFQELIRTETHIIIFGSIEGRTVFEGHSRGGTTGYESISLTTEDLEKLQDNLRSLYRATCVTPGTYDVITSPLTSGILAHESFGHGVEMDLFLKRNAKARFYMNKQIASTLVTMKDDPSLPGGYGTYFFDDEGVPSRPTTIIDDGILKRGLSDISSALALRSNITGNGRRESFMRRAYARMSNTFIEPQNATLEELMSAAGDGMYLESPTGGIEDPQGWGIQVTAKIGREFKRGRFTGKTFSPVAITGYVPDLLKGIRGVGADFRMFPGLCGKGYKEMIKVGLGGPHILTRCRLG